MSNLKCCGTCQYHRWSREFQEFQCWKEGNLHDGEHREYWDTACSNYKQEVYVEYDAYTK